MSDRLQVLFLDNFDSFSYNLVDEFEKRGAAVSIYRNDVPLDTLEAVVAAERPRLLVVSPGPATPARAGVCLAAIRAFAPRLAIFGVCLGHQAIVEAFGGEVGRAPLPVHGKVSLVHHTGRGVFAGLPSPLAVGRYHSLVATRVPPALDVLATSADGLVMAVGHRQYPTLGVQFHPESILTAAGGRLIERLLADLAGAPADATAA